MNYFILKKKRAISFLLLSYLIIVFSCNQEESYLIKTKKKISSNFELAKRKIDIQIDEKCLNYYPKSTILELEGNTYLIGFNNRVHSIDIFDLHGERFDHRISLQSEGPNAVYRIRQITASSLDSIFVFDSSGTFKLLNSSGTIINGYNPRVNINNSKSKPMPINEARLFYKKNTGELFFHLKPEIIKHKGSVDITNLKSPIVGVYNFKTNKSSELAIQYPKYALKHNDSFSSDLVPNLTFTNEKIVMNYIFESNVYAYEFSNNHYNEFGGESEYTNNLVDPYVSNIPVEQLIIINSKFNSTFFIDSHYYRTQWNEQPLKNGNGLFNSLISKPASISIWNSSYEIIHESMLDRKEVIPESAMNTKEELLLWADPMNYNKENMITLYAYHIEEK